ncbi:MAG TPA: hypothetical protein VEI02_15235 [Planctomycetota bacterium]|nr:hypothetical protein [Planctomycetota bacterium]
MGSEIGAPARRRRFMRVEVAVVAAVLAGLAGVTAPVLGDELDGAKVARAGDDLDALADAFAAYVAATGRRPSDDGRALERDAVEAATGFACLYADVHGHAGWDGPYLRTGCKPGAQWVMTDGREGFLDPWGRPYRAAWFFDGAAPDGVGSVALFSQGADGETDTSAGDLAAGAASGDDVVRNVAGPRRSPR